jgi:preprotein translocase subunit YajC
MIPMVDFAYAAAQMPNGGGSGAVMTQVLFFAAIFAIFYFLLIRPQQRQRRERETTLRAVKKGDRVVTTGGIHGTVVGLNDNTMTLKVADQTKMDFDRAALGRIVPAQGEKESGA